MRWLPVFYCHEHCICAADGELEGWLVGVEWRCVGLVLELSFAKRARFVDERG